MSNFLTIWQCVAGTTAYCRNPNYHLASDTADTLDYRRMAKVVQGVYAAVLALGG